MGKSTVRGNLDMKILLGTIAMIIERRANV
ncbi:MAG: hypothetical protein K0R54_3520 [Clostridiaceae bacterium]|jgi:hypothetical protein|nr:hypothetical protein [Clostridiaceae bacterium]